MLEPLSFVVALVALLLGLAGGKAWERYKLRDGRWIDRRRARDSQHYVLGLNFLVSNQIDLAIEELSQAARVDTDALEIHLILGNVYRERGQVAKAIQVHQALLQRAKLTRTEHAYVLLCLGLDFKRGGFVDRALEAFSEVRRLDPHNRYALLYLQKLHEEQQQWDEALRVGRQLAELSGPETSARSQSVLAYLENERGASALKVNDLATAAARFTEAIARAPATVPAYLNLGDLQLGRGDQSAAISTWERLVTAVPDRAYLALTRLSRAHAAAGHPERFEQRCRQLIDATPSDWRARLALSRHLASRGDSDAAFELLLTALSYHPHSLLMHQALWEAMLQLGLPREHVQRYLESSRRAVFFLDPHLCTKCHYRATELLWQCPHCHEWDTFVEERIDPGSSREA